MFDDFFYNDFVSNDDMQRFALIDTWNEHIAPLLGNCLCDGVIVDLMAPIVFVKWINRIQLEFTTPCVSIEDATTFLTTDSETRNKYVTLWHKQISDIFPAWFN